MIEIAAKMIFIPKHFFHHKVEVFDALVVIVAWSLDIVLFVDPYLVHSAVCKYDLFMPSSGHIICPLDITELTSDAPYKARV